VDDKDLRKQRDFDDYNRELAGVGTRIERFLGGNSPKDRIDAKRESDRRLQTQLDLLMMNPAFAAAYEAANTAIDDTQKLLNKAMSTTAQNIERLTDLIEDMEERTAKLEDGTAVFRDSNGRLRTADGSHLSEAETASLLNTDSIILSYEPYKDARDALQSARARMNRLDGHSESLEDIRERVKTAETPEELKKAAEDARALQEEIKQEQSIGADFEQSAQPSAAEMVSGLKLELETTRP